MLLIDRAMTLAASAAGPRCPIRKETMVQAPTSMKVWNPAGAPKRISFPISSGRNSHRLRVGILRWFWA
ncbi:MAG: hypothetical protein L6W00_07880 [Lentisphaeria bacterium]|nr:MAG: hypothetical protein L6W00_07880 [Lentisphaeria bacterium]